jgi:hypothetical protein
MTALAVASPLADSPGVTAASSVDRVIRVSTAVAVLAVAGVAAYVSYWHAYAVVRAHGESGITARLEPATIDGLVYASSMVVLYAARHRLPAPALARWLLGLGIAATLTANMAQGWSHGPVGAAVAAWPAVSLVGSYELLVWLIRTAGALGQGPPAEPGRNGAPCCALARPVPTAAADEGQRSQGEPGAPRQTRRPMSQPAPHPGAAANVQDNDEVSGADAVNDQAVAAYRLSVQAGNPLSERKLASMFGRTSRRWARTRITQARRVPQAAADDSLPTPIASVAAMPRPSVQARGWNALAPAGFPLPASAPDDHPQLGQRAQSRASSRPTRRRRPGCPG